MSNSEMKILDVKTTKIIVNYKIILFEINLVTHCIEKIITLFTAVATTRLETIGITININFGTFILQHNILMATCVLSTFLIIEYFLNFTSVCFWVENIVLITLDTHSILIIVNTIYVCPFSTIPTPIDELTTATYCSSRTTVVVLHCIPWFTQVT